MRARHKPRERGFAGAERVLLLVLCLGLILVVAQVVAAASRRVLAPWVGRDPVEVPREDTSSLEEGAAPPGEGTSPPVESPNSSQDDGTVPADDNGGFPADVATNTDPESEGDEDVDPQ